MDELTRLLLAARDGSRDALVEVIRDRQAEVWRFTAHLVGTADADDVTQDTFVRAWRALPAYRGDASGRTWLLSIARRAAVDALRARGRRRRIAERVAAHAEGDVGSGDPAVGHELSALLASLDPSRREAFVLTQVLGCSYAQAAAVCDVPVGTIRSRIARAREQLIDQVRAAQSA